MRKKDAKVTAGIIVAKMQQMYPQFSQSHEEFFLRSKFAATFHINFVVVRKVGHFLKVKSK